jgi:hypothetical protein
VPTFRLPNVSGGGSITVQGANLADAQQQAASQSGVTLAQQQAGGTFGANSLVNGGGGAATPTGPQGFNAQAADIAARVADNAAQQAYLRARLNLDTDIEANKKAQQAWQNTFDQAKFDFQKQIDAANVTGVYNGAPTLAAQAEQNKTSLGYLGLISNLQGPQDYGAYLRTLGSTPGGLRDLVSAAAGKYVPAAGATTGVASTPASLGGLVNAAATGQSGGTNYGDYMNAAKDLPAGNQISPDAWNTFTSSQKQALLGMYGQTGQIPQDVQDLYKQSLPQYAYSGSPTGSVKL